MFVSVRFEIGTKKLQFLKEEYPLLFTDLELVESLFKNCNLCKYSSSGFASKTCFQKRDQSTMWKLCYNNNMNNCNLCKHVPTFAPKSFFFKPKLRHFYTNYWNKPLCKKMLWCAEIVFWWRCILWHLQQNFMGAACSLFAFRDWMGSISDPFL